VWSERICAYAIFNTWRRSKHCAANVARACTSALPVALPKPGTYRPLLLMHRARDFNAPSLWVAAPDATAVLRKYSHRIKFSGFPSLDQATLGVAIEYS
jgi:hypothetical protein